MKLIITGVKRTEEVTKFDGQDEPFVNIGFSVTGKVILGGDESAAAITTGEILNMEWQPRG